jgi:hypothetical protein
MIAGLLLQENLCLAVSEGCENTSEVRGILTLQPRTLSHT